MNANHVQLNKTYYETSRLIKIEKFIISTYI